MGSHNDSSTIASIQKRMNDVDSEGFALLYGDKRINFDSTVRAFLEGKLDGNRISGQAISDLRNRYSREVRNLLRQGGEAAQRRGIRGTETQTSTQQGFAKE